MVIIDFNLFLTVISQNFHMSVYFEKKVILINIIDGDGTVLDCGQLREVPQLLIDSVIILIGNVTPQG
jgi:hypothetical protein